MLQFYALNLKMRSNVLWREDIDSILCRTLLHCLNIAFIWLLNTKKIECNNCVSRESMLVYQLGFGRWFWFCVSDKIVILSFFVKWYIWYIFRLETYFNEPFSKYTMLFFLLEQHYFIIKYILTVPTWVLSRTILSCINFQIVNFSTFIIGIWTLKHIIPQSFCKYWNDWNISSDQQY